MKLKEAEKFMAKRIEELERAVYTFDEIIKPRAEQDKVLLKRLRDQQIKLESLMKKVKEGEQPSMAEIMECVPAAFRSNVPNDGG